MWLLIVVSILSGHETGSATITQQFSSQEACNKAAVIINQNAEGTATAECTPL